MLQIPLREARFIKQPPRKNFHQAVWGEFGAFDKLKGVFGGPGVPAEAVEQLFQVFYRASRSRRDTGALQGNGLGLAISVKVIERFGGGIHAENAESGGLCIVIELPLLEEQWDE